MDRRVAVALVLTLGLFPMSAAAQDGPGTERPERPNRALFGGGYGATEQSLIFSGEVGGGVGTNGPARRDDGTDVPSGDTRSSVSANADGALTYTLARRRLSFGATATSSSRYFPEAGGTYTSAQSGRVDAQIQAGLRTLIVASGGVSREPLSALALLPGLEDAAALPLVPLDYGIGDGRVVYARQDFGANLTHSLSPRISVGVGYHGNRARVTDAQVDRWSGGATGTFAYALGRGLSLRLGYGLDETVYEATDEEPERRVRSHRIDAGVDLTRALSISRRTTLSFSTGSVLLSDQGRRRYELVGSAVVRREIGRSWYSGIGYSRDVQFVDVLTRPTFMDTVTANVNGLVGRRVRLYGDGGVSRGDVGIATTDNTFVVYRTGVGMTVGLNRSLGLGVRYSYFRYRFDGMRDVPDEFPATALSRQAIRVSLDLYAPLFTRARRP